MSSPLLLPYPWEEKSSKFPGNKLKFVVEENFQDGCLCSLITTKDIGSSGKGNHGLILAEVVPEIESDLILGTLFKVCERNFQSSRPPLDAHASRRLASSCGAQSCLIDYRIRSKVQAIRSCVILAAPTSGSSSGHLTYDRVKSQIG